MTSQRRPLLALLLSTSLLVAPGLALAQDDTIKIGLLATFEGPSPYWAKTASAAP